MFHSYSVLKRTEQRAESDHSERNTRPYLSSWSGSGSGPTWTVQNSPNRYLLTFTQNHLCDVTPDHTRDRDNGSDLSNASHNSWDQSCVMTDTHCPFNQNAQAGFKVNIWPFVKRTTEIHHFALPDIASSLPFFARHVLRTVHTELKWRHSFFLKFFWRTSVFFLWGHWYPFLHFWWHLPWVSESGLDPLTCILHCLHAMGSSDSPLVWHLLTSWWPGWQRSCSWHSDMANQIYFVTYSAIMMNRSNGFYWMDWNSLRSCIHVEIACFFS